MCGRCSTLDERMVSGVGSILITAGLLFFIDIGAIYYGFQGDIDCSATVGGLNVALWLKIGGLVSVLAVPVILFLLVFICMCNCGGRGVPPAGIGAGIMWIVFTILVAVCWNSFWFIWGLVIVGYLEAGCENHAIYGMVVTDLCFRAISITTTLIGAAI